MDDRCFNDPKDAQAWINSVEGERGKGRDAFTYPRLKTWINRVAPAQILEIGCGQGICSDKIDLDGRHYTGVEPSRHLLDRALELYRHPNRLFIQGNAYDLPFPAEAFDAVFSIAVWHLLSDLQMAASELSRVLKTKGHFLITTANPDAYSAWSSHFTETKLEGRRFEGKMQLEDKTMSQDVLYFHTLDEIVNSLQAESLQIKKMELSPPSELAKGQSLWIWIEGKKS
jgi:SAM-dependent methyltransferase